MKLSESSGEKEKSKNSRENHPVIYARIKINARVPDAKSMGRK